MDSPDAEIYSQSQEKDRNHQKVTDTFYKFHTASHPWYQCFILCISISYFLENIHFVNPLWKSLKSAGAFFQAYASAGRREYRKNQIP